MHWIHSIIIVNVKHQIFNITTVDLTAVYTKISLKPRLHVSYPLLLVSSDAATLRSAQFQASRSSTADLGTASDHRQSSACHTLGSCTVCELPSTVQQASVQNRNWNWSMGWQRAHSQLPSSACATRWCVTPWRQLEGPSEVQQSRRQQLMSTVATRRLCRRQLPWVPGQPTSPLPGLVDLVLPGTRAPVPGLEQRSVDP